jgi:hypothetical protein
MALVRLLSDRFHVQQLAIHILVVHDDLGLWRESPQYPTLPNAQRPHRNRVATLTAG